MKPDKENQIPLYIQIRDYLKDRIRSGELSPGQRLPSVAEMAVTYSVTAATIRRALQDLAEDRLISSHVGRGTFVLDPPGASVSAGENASADANAATAEPRAPEQLSAPESRSGSARKLRDSLQRGLGGLMALANKEGTIAFTRGIADPDTIESGILERLVLRALSRGEELFRDYGDPRGLESLREEIARLYREDGLDVGAEHILVTSGSQQAISLIAQQAAEQRTPVLCETPCYAGVTNAFNAFALPFETVPRGEEGPEPEHLGPASDGTILYLCPVLHNPSGTDISETRRLALAQWAKSNNAVLLADEVFRDLHFGTPPRSFLSDPGPENSIIMGSLSKSFISGLRVGWIVSSPERIEALAAVKKAMDLGCPPLMQGIAREFLADDAGYRAHRARIKNHYRRRRDAVLAALGEYMPKGVSWSIPEGGFQLQANLPEGASSVELYLRAIDRGAAFLPGALQDIDNTFQHTFRLCYGSLSEKDIREGIKRIGEAAAEYLAGISGIRSGPGAGFGDF
ncbi:MAG: PLP-dependent aminotransferase family protein [Spirochaetales bacterium]|nr:PLP-dependent aminotransferase family protein [Spirochaetales bacterium]